MQSVGVGSSKKARCMARISESEIKFTETSSQVTPSSFKKMRIISAILERGTGEYL